MRTLFRSVRKLPNASRMAPPGPAARFPLRTTWSSVTVPPTCRAPPLALVFPPLMVRPEMVKLGADEMNSPNAGAPAPRWMVSRFSPGPVMVRVPDPADSVGNDDIWLIVRGGEEPGSKTIVSSVIALKAFVIAWRKLPDPCRPRSDGEDRRRGRSPAIRRASGGATGAGRGQGLTSAAARGEWGLGVTHGGPDTAGAGAKRVCRRGGAEGGIRPGYGTRSRERFTTSPS